MVKWIKKNKYIFLLILIIIESNWKCIENIYIAIIIYKYFV